MSASDLVASSSYTIRVTTDSSGIGFNNRKFPRFARTNRDRRTRYGQAGRPARGDEQYVDEIYGPSARTCAITTGTVMAELHSCRPVTRQDRIQYITPPVRQVGTSGGALATAAVDVTVKLPSPMSFDSLLWPPAIVEDRSDGFSVLVSESQRNSTKPNISYRGASIEPSMAAGFGDCSTNSKVSATFRGTRYVDEIYGPSARVRHHYGDSYGRVAPSRHFRRGSSHGGRRCHSEASKPHELRLAPVATGYRGG